MIASAPRPPPSIALRAAANGLWAAVLLGLLRAALLFAMERLGHGAELGLARARLAAAWPEIGLQAALAGLLAGALAQARHGWTGGRAARLAAVLLLAALLLAFLAGWSSREPSRALGWGTDRGRAATLAVALLAAGLAPVVLALCRRLPVPRRALLALLPPAAAALAVPLAGRALLGGVAERMRVRRVVAELLDPAAAQILEGRADAPPYVGTHTPSIDYQVDGADRPAWVIPPPGRIRLEIPEHAGVLWLAPRAGIDRSVLEAHEERLAGHAVRFTVAVAGDELFRGTIPIRRVGKPPGTEWLDVAGAQGLALRPGTELELACALLDPGGAEVRPPFPLAAGFGGLALESRWDAPRTRSSPRAPNIVLVVMDTQRADRLSAYGYGRPTSPHLERLAARGTLFEAAYSSASWTWPATASLLTGLLPEEHGVLSSSACFLDEQLETLAEALQDAGFTTAAWSANPLIVPDKNFDQGFEVFDHGNRSMRKSGFVVPAVLEWLEAVAGTRFFLYLHLVDPHAPLDPRPEDRALLAAEVPPTVSSNAIVELSWKLLEGEGALDELVSPAERGHIGALYDACVRSGDHWVGQVLERLEALGLADETLVAYTSDHGEELFDHGLAAHGHSLHAELVRVPLVLAGPGVAEGARVRTPVSTRQLAPTLARLAGTRLGQPADATDLLEGGREPAVLFSTEQGWWNGRSRQPLFGLRVGDEVLHLAPRGGSPGAAGSAAPAPGADLRLYDVAADPGETRDLAAQRADRARVLRAELERLVAELRSRRRVPLRAAGDATLEVLRDLGYVGGE